MNLSTACLLGVLCFAASASASAGESFEPDRKVAYKKIGTKQLRLHVFEPEGWAPTDRRSAVVFSSAAAGPAGRRGIFTPRAGA